MLSGIKFVSINKIGFDKASIMYSVKLTDEEDKELLVSKLQNLNVPIYGKVYTPDIFLNGELLCITINKECGE